MRITSCHSARLLLGAASLALSMNALSDTTLTAVGGGWFTDAGEHIQSNDNYAVGGSMDGYTRNNYFLFSLSGVNNPITSATLRIFNPSAPVTAGFPFGYTSADPTETYALFGVSTPAAVLGIDYGVGSVAGQDIFADLGTGQKFGAYIASLADNGHFVDITLNAAGLAALNAGNGVFAVGGSITTLDNVVNKESLFVSGFLSSVGPNVPQLVVSSVPEPSESGLLVVGLALVGLVTCGRIRNSDLKGPGSTPQHGVRSS